MADEMDRNRDLVLTPNTYAYVLDSTKGKVSVYVGPFRNSLSNTDQLVVWDEARERFEIVNSTDSAKKPFPRAKEGQYIALSGPAKGNAESHPPLGVITDSAELDAGRRVIVPGPAIFPLWPGQSAETIDGHHLRHNQFLLVRVYEPEQAKLHWGNAVMAPQMPTAPVDPPDNSSSGDNKIQGSKKDKTETSGDEIKPPEVPPTITVPAREFTMGQLTIIKGTEVSFYIPPTGVEVVPDPQTHHFVREAATLERLEYCILLDENGEKRYVQGPAVVFPEPTETFVEDNSGESGQRKFKAIELNPQSGLYVKVIANYSEGGKQFRVGQELFITGSEDAIYFPRPEHSIIKYGDQQKHHAIAIPAGEGRYVLDRTNGKVELVRGPKMFLPDPRTQVVVRRILDRDTVAVLFPDNREALDVNEEFRLQQQSLAPGEFLSSGEARSQSRIQAFNLATKEAYAGDTITRGTSFSEPRSIVLDTKYQGAVSINVWPGYAVLVTKKSGERRVVSGPENILLEYDESLMVLELSTGRPKTDDRLLRTAYLRTVNNQVSDKVEVETRDLVPVAIELSYRVNFVGAGEERSKWFDIENYVKVLTDHCRSRLRNAAKHYGIDEFYRNTIDIVRDTLLGVVPENGERPGLLFNENGMRLYDIEVLNVDILDRDINELMSRSMSRTLTGAIELLEAEEQTKRDVRLQELDRQGIDEREKTEKRQSQAALAGLRRTLEQQLAKVGNDHHITVEEHRIHALTREDNRAGEEQKLEFQVKRDEAELSRLRAEVEVFVTRMGAINGGVIEALQAFGDKNFARAIVEAIGPAALAAGITTADLLEQVFKNTPFEDLFGALAVRPNRLGSGNES